MKKLNKLGEQLYSKWDRIYREELERLRTEKNDPDYTEGWCIIDSYDFVRDFEDEVGLLVFGYDDNLDDYFNEQREFNDEEYLSKFFRDVCGTWYSMYELEEYAKRYYTSYEELDAEIVRDECGRKYVRFNDGVEWSVLLGFEYGATGNESDINIVFDEDGLIVTFGYGLSDREIVESCICDRQKGKEHFAG